MFARVARGGAAASVAALVLGSSLLSTAPAADAATTTQERVVLDPGSTVTVAGRGYGHGRGMSQWGARAAAAQGVGYQRILDAYYPGTVSVTQPASTISVLISGDTDDDVRILAVPGMTASDAVSTGTPISFGGTTPQQWRIVREPAGFILYGLVGGTWQRWSQGASPGYLSISAPSNFIRLIQPNGSQTDYRGTVRAVPEGSSPNLRTVNVVGLEDYLRSVVPAESPSSWPADALRAQAVAARTYASYDRAHRTGAWQTCDTTQCQVYAGHKSFNSAGVETRHHEAASTDAAVAATAGQVRHYGGALAFTQFGSSNGGWSAAGSFPYLAARPDPWDSQGNPVHAWSTKLRTDDIRARYPAIGTPRSIDVTSRTGDGEFGGRVVRVVLTGSAGTVSLSGSQFRTAFGLRSDWWKITGTSRLDSDSTNDGRVDVLGQTADGRLTAYVGDGEGRFVGSRPAGHGWQSMRLVVRANDLDGDGRDDVLAADGNGVLWRYPTAADGTLGQRVNAGSGWNAMRLLIAPGDLGRDGSADILAVDHDGLLWLYPGLGDGTFAGRHLVGSGWQTMTWAGGGGDWDGDGWADFLAVDGSGRLFLYRSDRVGSFFAVQVGSGWRSMRLLTTVSDFGRDGIPDLLAADSAGRYHLYPWTGTRFAAPVQVGHGWSVMARAF
ncbi:SpoIID/LytB domain-containing protein [Cellulosimicrobium cellulans]|uniref:SpoIID/LytB domain-containing protein n=1 Tax=Cellulosimicrobium cellulans TaxID=1710 RepID=UPI001495793B|nr:SpoIID/LytB domain-containing protein [Cellulosimicrobium cellulans]